MAGDRKGSNFWHQKFRDFMATDVPKASDLIMSIYDGARKVEVGGKSLNTEWAHEKYPGVGVNVLTDAGDYPTALASAALNPNIGLAHMAFAVDFSGHLEAQGTGSSNAFVKGKWAKKKAKELRDKAQLVLARFITGDGTPNWFRVGASPTTGAAGSFSLAATSILNIHAVQPGELLEFYSAATGGTLRGTATVTDVEYLPTGTALVHVDTLPATVVANDYVSLSGFHDAAVLPEGLQSLITATGTIQGINRATAGNFMYRATEVTSYGAMTTATVDELRDYVQDVADTRSGKYATKWVGNRAMRREAASQSASLVRFTSFENTLGAAKMKVNDKDGTKDFIEEKQLLDGQLYAICPEKMIVAHPQGMAGGYPVMNGGSAFWQANAASGTGHADRKILYWVLRTNFGADDFRCQGRFTGIT